MSNTQENDKFLTKERKIYLEALIIVAIYLAITLPLHFCVPAFSWHWFVFGLIFLIIPLGLICFKTFFVNKMTLTDEQQKKFNQALGIGMLKLWLADFVYMSAFNHWLIPTYILGIIVLIIVFNSLVNAFLGKRDNNSFLNFCLAADLIIGIALTIYLIYIIPENTGNLQNIITTIVAAIYGGLLTLVGVAWTIKKSDKNRKEEERKKYKPYFNFILDIDPQRPLKNDNSITMFAINNETQKNIYFLSNFYNSKNSILKIISLKIGENTYSAKGNVLVIEGQKFTIFFHIPTNINLLKEKIILTISDILGNYYQYHIKTHKTTTPKKEEFYIVSSIEEISEG